MFENILVPLDGSSLAECVLPHVVAVAHASESQVTLLRVLDPVSANTRRLVDPLDWQIRKAEAETYLQDLTGRLSEQKLRVRQDVVEGKAAESVLEYAHSREIDLIMLSSHGQSGISGWNVSSVVQKIIARARTSLTIVRAYKTTPEPLGELKYGRILIPLDGSQRAEIVLGPAVALARFHNAEILIGHVVRQPEMPRRTPLTAEEQALANDLTERNRVEAVRYLDDIKSRLDLRVETRLLVSSKVTKALHDLVEREAVDLVMMSAHGYSGESQWAYGSVVISFIAYGTTPLLIVQDVPADRIEPTRAELAAQEQGGH